MAFIQLVTTGISLLLGWTILEGLRRLYFHPLSHIPGPRLAALTWWYDFYWDHIKKGRFVFHIQELHKIYGPIIRITPEEIHVCDVGFLDTIYASSATSSRDKYPFQQRSLQVPGTIGTTPGHDLHRRRRDVLIPFFSKKNVIQLEPLIAGKVKQLLTILSSNEGKIMNMTDIFFALSNDITNNFLFAHSTDFLSDLPGASQIRTNTYGLLKGIYINKHLPIIPAFFRSLPSWMTAGRVPPGVADLMKLLDRVKLELITVVNSADDHREIAPGSKESIYNSILTNPNLPESEKSLERLQNEGALLVMAGTESPAKTMNILTYHVYSNPNILRKLREELFGCESSVLTLERLPYLSAVIEESNRLSFGVTSRMTRVPHEPTTYIPSEHVKGLPLSNKSYSLPARTPMSTTTYAAHTAESVFPDPFKFDPDRWLGTKGQSLRKYQLAFSKGSRKCLGYDLARAELCLATAALVMNFDLELYQTSAKDIEFRHAYMVSMPDLDSKGIQAKIHLISD